MYTFKIGDPVEVTGVDGIIGIVSCFNDDPEFLIEVTFHQNEGDISDDFAPDKLKRVYDVSPFIRLMRQIYRTHGTWAYPLFQRELDAMIERNDPRDFQAPTR